MTKPTTPQVGSDANDHGRAGRNLPAAIAVGLVLVGMISVTLAWWNLGFVLMVGAALCVGAHEVHMALRKVGMTSAIVPIVIGTFVIVVGSYYAGHRPRDWSDLLVAMPWNTVLLAGLGGTVLAALIWRIPRGPEGFVRDAAASLFIIGYVALLGSFVTLLLAGENGAGRVIAFIITVAASDTGGYVAGVLFGKHPLAPRISPKKSWEGLVGSFVFAMTAGTLLIHFILPAPWWVGLLLGAVCAVIGTLGDLIESLIKRDVGIKDMSSVLPGHGGLMDRLDSLLVAAPAAWLVLYLLVPGG